MITGTKEHLDGVAKSYVCSEHRTPVVVAWHAGENSYVLRCGRGHFPEEVTREPSLTEAYKQGEKLPGHIEDNVKKGLARREAAQAKQPTAVTMAGVLAVDLGTGELLPPEVLRALVDYARKYDLDPARGHVCLMYGKPYITLDGYLFHAKQTNLPYQLKERPLTNDERLTYQIPEGAHAWVCEVIKEFSQSSFIGLGIVTVEEMTEKSKKRPDQLASPVVAKHPWQLAAKRAVWQAMRRAFPIGETPQGEEE